ncbi:hypothetical protein Pcinc_021581 [Petrolisthes cinctipes]|uniref:Uncharacterized protein n=1 Tax=Petrolisthes cinctipes TaxID=88211 RepID=A0AAE1FFQ0_PETCI|nr:hypothetical protein Pcinc_021581 [Petrolisthes cinctipes]
MNGVVVSAGPSSISVISCCRVRFVSTWLASSARSGHHLPDLALGKFDSLDVRANLLQLPPSLPALGNSSQTP